jgi:hypothetical protein
MCIQQETHTSPRAGKVSYRGWPLSKAIHIGHWFPGPVRYGMDAY